MGAEITFSLDGNLLKLKRKLKNHHKENKIQRKKEYGLMFKNPIQLLEEPEKGSFVYTQACLYVKGSYSLTNCKEFLLFSWVLPGHREWPVEWNCKEMQTMAAEHVAWLPALRGLGAGSIALWEALATVLYCRAWALPKVRCVISFCDVFPRAVFSHHNSVKRLSYRVSGGERGPMPCLLGVPPSPFQGITVLESR